MKYAVIGAGPSGLTMGLFLKEDCQILEKENHPGGHASSFKDDGFTFDFGPHIMFSKDEKILRFMIDSLGKNIQKCRRNNKIWYKDRLLKYPFENDLKSLPPHDNYECLYSYLFNPYKTKYKSPKNFRQWLLYNFGKGICEKYLIPYNEKVWNIPVHKLSMILADRVPKPPVTDIIKSSIGIETEGYLHQLYYYYPLRGGYQAISDVWAKKLPIKYNFQVKKIKKEKNGTFTVSDGSHQLKFDKIISTIPIHELVKIIDIPIPRIVSSAVKMLIVNPTYSICLGIKGDDRNKYTAVYFPDQNFLVNRINFPKTFSKYNAPNNCYSIQADITCKATSPVWRNKEEGITGYVIAGLVKRGFIKSSKDIVYQKAIRSKYAYVVYDSLYKKNTGIIRDWFPKQGIQLVGRFSFFEYINVDGVIKRSLEIASKLNKSQIKLDGVKSFAHTQKPPK